MKHLILFFLTIPQIFFAQDSISVLFIGNSYTYVNDLPAMTNSLALSLGDKISFDSKTNGGYTFEMHTNDPLTYTKITNKPWDFVVLQGQSQEPSFPYQQVNQNTLPYALELADSVYANRFCSQTMYFMTWGRENGDPQWDSIATFNGMNSRLRDAYLRFTDSAQACVSPVGSAWRYVRETAPTIQLYSGDGSHPSLAGSYLAACTFYASLFRKSPIGASYIAGLDAATAGILQEAAALTVLDSIPLWHLRPTEEIGIANFSYSLNGQTAIFNNQSWRAQNYFWDFGDGNTSVDPNPVHTYASFGNYDVTLIAMNECGSDTLIQSVNVLINGISQDKGSNLRIHTIDNGFVIACSSIPESVSLMSVEGKILNSERTLVVEDKDVYVMMLDQPRGVYFLRVKIDGVEFDLKLRW